ncbi:hypothetical protein OPT61_g6315 [Boeremia exigua]|uniref:Uncharacterized protein n=1 Tax=Boeremia exigua TaxID=749465 RepID=A0ACC2I705_9PLEO|nr:hypothetical protein OPT61_g6315 [Boeremia exigua]
MATRKRKPQSTRKVPFAPTKASKKAEKSRAVAKRHTIPHSEPSAIRPFKLYKNRLLNLETTPPRLVAIVKLNTAASQLLRLPSEIRNLIWQYALSNELVRFRSGHQKGGAVRYSYSGVSHRARNLCDTIEELQPEKISSAFHLPEVCRQIYTETALLAYR